MDGDFKRTVLNTTSSNSKIAFTLDRSKQVLYWIRGRHSCLLESSNTDGSNRTVVYNATRYYGGCNSYYYMYSAAQAMDYFGGAVFTYNYRYRYIYKTTAEGRPYITRTNYMRYICRSSYRGMKVISRQRQLQSRLHPTSCRHIHLTFIVIYLL